MRPARGLLLTFSLFVAFPLSAQTTTIPLIDSVPPDLEVPPLVSAAPAAGKRVIQRLPSWVSSDVYHTLYLPTDYDPAESYPVIVEYAGNGNYRNSLGDVSTGLVDGSKLGFGITAGRGAIWVCLPFLSSDGQRIARTWWGDPPQFDVQSTLEYCQQCVPWICESFGGDPKRVVLAGFSRGAIACNYVGLHNEEISRLWCGFIAYSHYDGVRTWPFSEHQTETSAARLKRLGDRPQFICHESTGDARGLAATRRWIESTGIDGDLTFAETGFANHNDGWALRPSRARRALRDWFGQFR